MRTGLVGSRPLNLHTGGPASWCFQCGESGTPERAFGVDVDGEPACNLHRVREGSIFLEKRKVEPAAPSPQPATEQEKADMATCKGFGSRLGTCTEQVGEKSLIGLCTKCYANKNYADHHPGKRTNAPRERACRLKAPKGAEPLPAPEPQTGEQVMRLHGFDESERFIHLRLPESRVQRLLELLLQ